MIHTLVGAAILYASCSFIFLYHIRNDASTTSGADRRGASSAVPLPELLNAQMHRRLSLCMEVSAVHRTLKLKR